MEGNVIFNATVTLIGFLILSVHIVNVLVKKNRRRDDNALLSFFIFTALHFAAYFTFVLIKNLGQVKNDGFIMGFYTGFYIANNLEIFLLFLYMMAYVDVGPRLRKPLYVLGYALCGVFIALDVVNVFTRMFFTAVGGEYQRTDFMILSQIGQFLLFFVVFLVTMTNKKLNVREKVAFGMYCFLPLVAIFLQNRFKGYAIAYLSIILATEILFLFLSVEKNLRLAKEEQKSKEAQIKVMLSQIQPHFIYNSLSSISTLIPIDPEKAQSAIDDFAEYLRLNLSSLTQDSLIPFEDELRHIETFVALEVIRFPERVNMVYDLRVRDFYVPPLSLQPLVENAVKHGILKKIEGGTVTLRTYETETHYVVEVLDDGVGFNIDEVDFSTNEHVGLNNINYRIASMADGTLAIKNRPSGGVEAIVRFPKTGRKL